MNRWGGITPLFNKETPTSVDVPCSSAPEYISEYGNRRYREQYRKVLCVQQTVEQAVADFMTRVRICGG